MKYITELSGTRYYSYRAGYWLKVSAVGSRHSVCFYGMQRTLRIALMITFLLAGLSDRVMAQAKDSIVNGDQVVARYDDGDVTVSEFARRQPSLLSWAGIGVDADQLQLAVEDIVFESLLAEEARKSDLSEKPEVREQINRILKAAYLQQYVPAEQTEVSDAEIEKWLSGGR